MKKGMNNFMCRLLSVAVVVFLSEYCCAKTNNRKDHDLKGNVYAVVVKDIKFSNKFGEVIPTGSSDDTFIYFLKNGNVYKEISAPMNYTRFEYDVYNNVTQEIFVHIGAGEEYEIADKVYHLNDTTEHQLYQYIYESDDKLKEIKCFRKKADDIQQYLRIVFTYSSTGKKIIYRDENNIKKEIIYHGNTCVTKEYRNRSDKPDMTITETINTNEKPVKREVIVGNNWGIESWTYSYNNHGDKVKILHQAKVPGKQYSSVETIQYIYDQNGNWTRKMHYVDNNLKTWTEREILYAVSDSDYDKIVEETKKMEAESKAISNMVFSHIKHRQDSIQAVQLAVAEEEEASGHIYEGPEVLAHFPGDYIGGAENFMKWLGNQTFENEGHADVSFVVECDGSITCVKIVRSSGDDAFNNEAVRIVKSMPKWIPGYQNGQAVRSRFRIPIKVGY